jgi:hypothetical protein
MLSGRVPGTTYCCLVDVVSSSKGCWKDPGMLHAGSGCFLDRVLDPLLVTQARDDPCRTC